MTPKEAIHVVRNPYGYVDDYVREARHALCDEYERTVLCVEQLKLVVEDFLPNIGVCILQDYQRLNDSLVEAEKILAGWKKGL